MSNLVGDGVTDNLAAIQAQLNLANTAGGGEVFVPPPGTNVYAISASLIIYSNTTLRLAQEVTIRLLNAADTSTIYYEVEAY